MTVVAHDHVRAYWGANQVAEIPVGVTAEESLLMVEQRFRMYPGLEDLMPVDTCEGKDVLDFGCGPGHDTVGFLHNGAAHVYAADVSWKGLAATRERLEAHGWLDRATLMLVGDGPYRFPRVDHVHCAGVLHHTADPLRVLRRLAGAMSSRAELRLMVYSAESWFYRSKCGGDPERFRLSADAGSPISHAWTINEVFELADRAGLHEAKYVGSYNDPCEPEGPGLMSCYSLRQS